MHILDTRLGSHTKAMEGISATILLAPDSLHTTNSLVQTTRETEYTGRKQTPAEIPHLSLRALGGRPERLSPTQSPSQTASVADSPSVPSAGRLQPEGSQREAHVGHI